jgi:hypothetical protein
VGAVGPGAEVACVEDDFGSDHCCVCYRVHRVLDKEQEQEMD